MTADMIQKEQIQRAGGLLLQMLDANNPDHQKMVDSGYILSSQGRVFRAKLFGNKIIAIVQDVIPCQVNFHLQDPALSQCLCPGIGLCRHILAVFFHHYGRYFNERDWFQQFSGGNDHADSPAPYFSAIKMETASHEHWIEIVDTLIAKELADGDQQYPFIVNKRIQKILEQLATMEPTDQRQAVCFRVTTYLHLLNNLLSLFLNGPFSVNEYKDTCRLTVTTIFHNLEHDIDGLLKVHSETSPALVTTVRDLLRALLFQEGAFKKEIQGIYWRFWSQIRNDHRELLDEELEYSQELAQKSEPDSLWSIARSDLLFLNGRIEEAATILVQAGLYGFERLILWFDFLAKNGLWSAFEKLTPFFFSNWPAYTDHIQQMTARRFYQSLEPSFTAFFSAQDARDLYEKFLLVMLPHSTRKLIDFYYKQGEYRKLVDFMRVNDQSVTVLLPEQFRVIQEREPECLLPLLHHQIHVLIAGKNRQSYQEAVYFLKQLKAVYEQLERTDVWRHYFDRLLHVHQRLRAFQEECRKGGLIDG